MIPYRAGMHSLAWLGLIGVTLTSGCKSPKAYPFRTFHCVPSSADSTAPGYWENCGASEGSNAQARTEQNDATIADAIPPLTLASFQQVNQEGEDQGPLRLPPELPGADTEPLIVPSLRDLDAAEQRKAIKGLFPEVQPAEPNQQAMPESMDPRVGLESLHQLAHGNHPSLRAAAASVEVARGLMIQAGLPPNPKVGFQADTVNTANTGGYQGAYLTQTIVTARKLGLAAEAAAVDYANAVIEQRKVWVQVTSDIRRAYFQVLASRERVRLANALLDLASRAYNAQVELVAAGEAAPYEPLQLRVLTTQARATLVRAQQDAIAAWRTLAAAVGVPDLDVTSIEGRIDCAVPSLTYEAAYERMTAIHTDIQMAQNLVRKQQTLVTLADRMPIPNLDVELVVQRDFTFEPETNTYNLLLGGDVPVFNRNQGNRVATRADLVKAGQQVGVVRLNLVADLAKTYGVYQANRELADSFKTDALRDQVRAYRGVYQRYLADPNGVSFNDVIVAQQTLASVLTQYLDILQSQWQSVVDLGELLQVEDLFQMGPLTEVAETPSLE
ncbi:MAG: TolC family protein [Pirellula sp.]|nr:TolC family protein [Pirellula sp.]